MNLIVAVDNNWGIGYEGKLLTYLPGDLKYFKEKTLNKVVVMGRNTLESLPGGKPLKKRINVVLTRNKEYVVEGAKIINSIDTLLKYTEKFKEEDIFIIGGADIYKQLLPYCDMAYITKIDKVLQADKYIPNLYEQDDFVMVSESEVQVYNDIEYRFVVYRRYSD